ncbi:zein-binding domain-containing protein [Artemisia annua]|uniref:Zein-binding domain-containing protein n=1 Tax=Artemisia annua TaxID=35608 RepID=A0A2U1QCG9_ARTAN|nr:zein-binding domain-containing protein [Artemisia annua]
MAVTHKAVLVLANASLEWILIIMLLMNSFFSYLIRKFATYYALKPPCICCSYIDHLLEPNKNISPYQNLICEKHVVEFLNLYDSSYREKVTSDQKCSCRSKDIKAIPVDKALDSALKIKSDYKEDEIEEVHIPVENKSGHIQVFDQIIPLEWTDSSTSCSTRTYDVVHHLDKPASTSTSQPDPYHETNDSLVVLWMYSTISPKLVDMVIDDTTKAHEVWARLQALFHDNKGSRVIQLDNEIRNMAIGSLSVNDYFQEIKSKADHLDNLGSPDNTFRNGLLDKVSTLEASIKEKNAKIKEIGQHDYCRAKYRRKVVMFLYDDMGFYASLLEECIDHLKRLKNIVAKHRFLEDFFVNYG